MIDSVELIPVLKNGISSDEENRLGLWPPRRKAIKISADFNVRDYYFSVRTKEKCEDVKIIINRFEILSLRSFKKDDTFEYTTEYLSARYFLGFNLGIFELDLEVGHTKYRLATLNNKQGLLSGKKLELMYENVAKSDFFNFYISSFYRSNTLAKETSDTNSSHFWLRIALTYELHEEIKKFFIGELSFFTNIHKKSVIKSYSKNSLVSDKDIGWLIEHPDELSLSSTVIVSCGGLNFDINKMSQTIMSTNYDTYENRLLLTCLYSIKSKLYELSEEYKDTKLFPRSSVDRLIYNNGEIISSLNSKLKLSPPFETFPEYSNKFFDDVRYINLYSLISRWHTVNNLSYGNEFRSPILGVTEIFEHFCFIKIIESILDNGFALDDLIRKDKDTAGLVQLERDDDEVVSIFYEPCISKKIDGPLVNSKVRSSGYLPDIVVIYEKGNVIRRGIIDAKFSTIETIEKTLGPDIYYKYGLFLHGQDRQPLDFVFAMYPSVDEKCMVSYARDNNFIDNVKPTLGSFSIPFDSNAASEISHFILPMILGEASSLIRDRP